MIQLTFEPALDPFHAVFRLLRLRPILVKAGTLPRDHVRILDFYLLFPFRIGSIRLMPRHRKYRRLASENEAAQPYGNQPEDRVLFGRMEPMQVAALDTLATRELTDPARWEVGEVMATSVSLPAPLADRAEIANRSEAGLMEFLGALAAEYQLLGPDGLKSRTGLQEYRYDAV